MTFGTHKYHHLKKEHSIMYLVFCSFVCLFKLSLVGQKGSFGSKNLFLRAGLSVLELKPSYHQILCISVFKSISE